MAVLEVLRSLPVVKQSAPGGVGLKPRQGPAHAYAYKPSFGLYPLPTGQG